MTFVKYIIFGIIVIGITFYLTQKNVIPVIGTYEDCVIHNVKDAKDESAVSVIKSMCKQKYNVKDSFQPIDKDKVKDQLNEFLDLFKEFQKQFEEKMK